MTDLQPKVRIILRPIGVPLPLGMVALGIGSLLLSAEELGWLADRGNLEVGVALVALVVPLQLLCGILGFLARDPVAGTGVTVLAAGWLVTGLDRIIGGDSRAYGIALIAVAVALMVPAITSALTNLVLSAIVVAAAARFALSGAFAVTDNATVEDLAGLLGLLIAPAALYAALALELEALGRPLLPMARRGQGKTSLQGDLDSELEGIEHEAGVRRQL